jgi:hypothetical protein
MPAGDGMGPVGMGPRSGRGMGYCGGYEAPGWANWGPGRMSRGRSGPGPRGRRMGGYGPGRRGGGRGWRQGNYAAGAPRWARWDAAPIPPSREQEIDVLKDEAEWLKEQLDAIGQRMNELGQE